MNNLVPVCRQMLNMLMAILLLPAAVSFAAPSKINGESLEEYRTIYDARMKTLDAARGATPRDRTAWLKNVVKLSEQYMKCLVTLQKKLVIENKLEEAKAVQRDLRRATFLLADARSKLQPPEVAAPETMETCGRCKGKKEIMDSCPYCKGTSKCSGCEGTGKKLKMGSSSATVRHALCRGSGKCPRCFATGKIKVPCPTCFPIKYKMAMRVSEQ